MSNDATAFGIYLIIGLLLMTLTMVTRAKGKGHRGYSLVTGDLVDAFLLLTIALAWPVWTVVWLTKKEKKDPAPK